MAEYGEALSEREIEVVELVATGATNRQIAQALVLSVNTVKVHLRNIFIKLGVESRTEASMIAIHEGWINIPTEKEITGTDQAAPDSTETDAPASADRPQPLPPLPWTKRLALVLSVLVVALLSVVTWPQARTAANQIGVHSNNPVNGSGNAGLTAGSTNWRALAPMTVSRTRLALAAQDGQLYAIGGETNGGVTGAMERYDPDADQWVPVAASKPTRTSNVSAGVIGEWIYVPGGLTPERTATATVEAYHLPDERWHTVSALPQPLAAYALAVHDNKLYLFGGIDDRGYVDTTFIYDPGQDRWEKGKELPTPRAYAAAAPLGDQIFVIGGYDGNREQNACEVYHPKQNTWQSCEPLTQGRSGLGLAAVANRLYAVGGGWSNYLGFSEKYNPDTGNWTPFETPLSQQWLNLSVAATSNKFYVAGGWNGEYLNGLWEYAVLSYEIYIPAASP
jgi:DNA-binding CsgD family transcriptional regulator/N-acetylneuraminic acid mutarotase